MGLRNTNSLFQMVWTISKPEKGAYEKIVWAIKSKFFDTYSRFLEETVLLKEDETHQDILLDVQDKPEKGIYRYITFKAVKRVLPKHKFESLFQYKEDADEDFERMEDTPDEPPMKRMRPFPHWRKRDDCKMMYE